MGQLHELCYRSLLSDGNEGPEFRRPLSSARDGSLGNNHPKSLFYPRDVFCRCNYPRCHEARDALHVGLTRPAGADFYDSCEHEKAVRAHPVGACEMHTGKKGRPLVLRSA